MFNLSEVTNPNAIIVGKESANFTRYGNIVAKSGEEVVFSSSGKPFILDHLEIASNSKDNVQFRIYLGDGINAGQRLQMLRNDGVTIDPITAGALVNHPSGLFNVLWYNDQYTSYKYTLKEPIICPEGVVVAVLNSSADTDHRAGDVGFGRYI